MVRNSTFTSFGSWVRARRRQLDLTQAELGKRASCSEATIRKIEAEERKPSVQLAELLAHALSIPLDDYRHFMAVARGAFLEDEVLYGNDNRVFHHNLPPLLTSTIDRVQAHVTVTALLKDNIIRLVTIIGPPGIGKTRLSILCGMDLLGEFPDGVWFVDLSDVCNPLFFAPAIARTLPEIDFPPSPDLDHLIRGLKNKKYLLILDNFEQIVEGAAMKVASLLKYCPHVKILVTSRLPLNIYGENEYPLPLLATPPHNAFNKGIDLLGYESVQLLVARIRLHQPQFSITEKNAKIINEICSILDGIPLAIELAAATSKQKTLEDVLVLLNGHDWTGKIGTSARDLPYRQRTLENVIEWSFLLLDDDVKNCYARLGVLSGWFDAEAAAAICEKDNPKIMDYLFLLSEHSLLSRGVISGHTSWRMLELIRAHAYSKLPQPDQIELIRTRYFVEKIKAIQLEIPNSSQEDYINAQLRNAHSSLAWAIANGKTDFALELVIQLQGYWYSLGYVREGLEFCRQLFPLIDSLKELDQLKFLQISSDLGWQQHDFDAALFFLHQHGKLARAGGFKGEYPLYLNRLGRIFIEQANFVEANAALHEALEHALVDSSRLNPGLPLAQLGEIALFEGNLKEAEDLFQNALSYLDSNQSIFLAMAWTDLAEIALANNDRFNARNWLIKAFKPAQNHIRRLIIFLSALSGYLILGSTSHAELVARFYGFIDKLSEHSGLPLGIFYQKVNQKRIQYARNVLSNNAWQAAYSEGQNWNKENVIQNADQALHQLD